MLAHLIPSSVVLLNRAVAIGMADGPSRGLALVDQLAADPALRAYPPLAAVRATLLGRLGRADDARREFQRAATLTSNTSEQRLYRRQADALDPR